MSINKESESAAGDAFNNTFHKVRAEVSMDWWQRIWAKAVEWERGRAALAAQPEAVGEPYAYAVYFPDEQRGELVHDLDELLEDMTNETHEVTPLFAGKGFIVSAILPASGAAPMLASAPTPEPMSAPTEAKPATQPEAVGERMEAGLKVFARRFGHIYWGAGEKDCPDEIKAPNGELFKLRCKKCGEDNPKSKWCSVDAAAPTEAKPDESLFNLLFAVEQAANNGALHWEVEEAFRAYEVSKAAVMHKPSGFTFDQVIACATPDDLMPLTAQIHPTTEPDCSGGIACTTCPDKRKCQRGCIRQGEALENPNRKDLRTECDAVDALLRGLGLDPDRCRTEGGVLNVGRTLSLLKDGCTEAKPAQPCGHPESLLLKSAETGEPLYCEACDDKSGRRDAEQRETELLAANQALREKIAALSTPAQQDEALLHQALDALEHHREQTRPIHRTTEAIAALRARLGPQPAIQHLPSDDSEGGLA